MFMYSIYLYIHEQVKVMSMAVIYSYNITRDVQLVLVTIHTKCNANFVLMQIRMMQI